jgi:ABC-type transport system substrate-binding protein
MLSDSKFNGRLRDPATHPFGFWAEAEVDALIKEQSETADIDKRKELVQRANRITSDKVASAFLFHPNDALVYHSSVNYPDESRIPGLVELDRVTVSG